MLLFKKYFIFYNIIKFFKGRLLVSNTVNLIYDKLFLEKEKKLNISVFVSGAEQVGTTWCGLSITHALNIHKKKVLFVDGNGCLSNVSSYLALIHPYYLEDYFEGKKTLNQLIFAYKNKDFNILTANSGGKYLIEQSIGRIQLFSQDLQILAENYSHIAIDLGAGIDIKNLSLCQIAKNIIILCSDNNADIVRTFDTIRFMTSVGLGNNCKLIINKVNSYDEGYKTYEKLKKATERNGLNFPELLGIIRLDARIRDTIKNKELLLSRYIESEAAQDILEIAKKLSI